MVVVAAAAAAVVAAVVVDLFVGLLVYPIFIVFLKRWILKAGKFVSAFLRFHIRQVRFCLQSSSMLPWVPEDIFFFLMDTDGSRRSRVNEAQSAEEKKISSPLFFALTRLHYR